MFKQFLASPRRQALFSLVLVFAALAWGRLSPASSQARTFPESWTVYQALDTPVCFAQIGSGTVFSSTDALAVQQAVDAAPESDTVKVAGYCNGVQSRAGTEQTVHISKTLILRGGYTSTNWTTFNPAANPTILDANQAGRVAYLTGGSSVSVTLENLTFRNGMVTGTNGGGIYSENVTLTLSNTLIRDNSAPGNDGGGIVNAEGTLAVINSTVSDNSAGSWAGGIENSGVLTLINSTLSGNQSTGSNPDDGGGAINQYGIAPSATIIHSTIVSNTAANTARGGIWLEYGTLTLQNSIVAGNNVTNDVAISGGTFTSQGYNLTTSGASAPFTATTDITETHPWVGPLQDNGSSTWTHALLLGSPAIDRIPNGANGCGTSLTTDQRGQPRPGTFTHSCDIGAYEAQGIHYLIYLPVVVRQ